MTNDSDERGRTDSVFPAPLWYHEQHETPAQRTGCAPLSRDDNGLTGAISTHGGVGVLGDGEEVGLKISSSTTIVCLDDFWAIESDTLEGVDGNEDDARICIDAMLRVTIADGMKDWRCVGV